VLAEFTQFGTNLIAVNPGRTTTMGMSGAMIASVRPLSMDDVDALERVAASGFILRFDPEVWPTMWRCATVSEQELEQLRRIDEVIRAGHVRRIDGDGLRSFEWCLHHVLRVACENGLPMMYRAEIAAVPARSDSDPGRRERELAVYR